jgi:two-component system response regulator AtoC
MADLVGPPNSPRRDLTLVSVTADRVRTMALPQQGEVTLGSGADCEIRIQHPSVSARHARLRLGATLEVEDLSSERGTRVRDALLEPGAPAPIALGDPLLLGEVLLVIQKRSGPAQRRIWSHGYFEARLEEECIRAERMQGAFAVMRVRCTGTVPLERFRDALSDALRLVDVVGSYSAQEYEALLLDTKPPGARVAAERIQKELADLGTPATIGLACFPSDGREPNQLAAEAGQRARGDSAPDTLPLAASPLHMQQLVDRIAATDINVLILGETGVGKERLAETMHRLSARRERPFLGLNVTALTDSLLESELFGHERGAFTGAVQTKLGLLESADGGTVLLDEIGEMPMGTQSKLLRVLETHQVLRVGGIKPRTIDVRFLAATNRDLEAEIRRGTFREDLYYRLNGISFVIPPLRERLDEIEGLSTGFIAEATRKYQREAVPTLSREALALMKSYAWPGNIRELRNVLERAVVISTGPELGLEHMPVEKMTSLFAARTVVGDRPNMQARGAPEVPPVPAVVAEPTNGHRPGLLQDELRLLERQRIIEALAQSAGNQTVAAQALGMSRRTFVKRLRDYDIPRPRGARGDGSGGGA